MVAEIKNEMMFINAWVKQEHADAKVYPRMRLGKPQNADPYMKPLLGYVDKVVITKEHVLLIEGKIKPNSRAVGQLLQYKKLFTQTPEFEWAWEYPILMILLTPVENKMVKEFAEDQGIYYIIFRPPEVEELLKKRFKL